MAPNSLNSHNGVVSNYKIYIAPKSAKESGRVTVWFTTDFYNDFKPLWKI